MIVGLVLIANLAAALSGLIALMMGANNVLMIMLLAGHGVPLLFAAGLIVKAWASARLARVVSGVEDIPVRS